MRSKITVKSTYFANSLKALTLYGAKNSNGVEYLEDGADYAFSILDEKDGTITVLVEEPVYSSRKWTVARIVFEVDKDGNISEKERLEKEDKYTPME